MLSRERRRRKKAVMKFMAPVQIEKVIYKVPSSLVDAKILEDLPTTLDSDNAKAILYYIAGKITHENIERLRSLAIPFESVPLNHKLLSRVLGKDFTPYLNFFLDKKVLTRSAFQKGVHSYKYNIDKTYRSGNYTKVEIIYAPIAKRIKTAIHEYNVNQQKLSVDLSDTVYWFTTDKLQIDRVRAKDYLKTLKNRQALRVAVSQCDDEALIDLITKRLPTQLKQGQRAIKDVLEKNYKISVSTNGGRLYSLVSMMMSPLRNFLTYDSKQLVAIDIKNSQPFHFCFLLNENFWSSQSRQCSFLSLDPILFETLRKDTDGLSLVRKIVREHPLDVQHFIRLTTEGKFYEYMCDLLGSDYIAFSDRSESKIRFLQFLNFDGKKGSSSAYGDYRKFKEKFPNVCTVLEFIKSRYYTDSSRVLQKLESKMVLHVFTKRFTDTFPEIPVFTIHDSIITLAEFQEKATIVLNEVYTEIFGFHPLTDGGKDLSYEAAIEDVENYIDDKAESFLKQSELPSDKYELLKQKFQEYAA